MAAVPGGAGLTPVTRFVETQDGVQLAYRSWVGAVLLDEFEAFVRGLGP